MKGIITKQQEQEREEDETCPKCNYPKYKNNFEDFERSILSVANMDLGINFDRRKKK